MPLVSVMVLSHMEKRETTPPGPVKKWEVAYAKTEANEKLASAYGKMEVPFMLTVSGGRVLTTNDWMDIAEKAISSVSGIDVRVDGFRQPRDRSIHLAIYGLPKEKEAAVVLAVKREARWLRSKKKYLVVVGGSLHYFFNHSEIASRQVAT